MAVIGGWVMWTTRDVWPRTVIQRGWAIAWLTLPLGFFVGWMDHGFSGVLYSDSLPRGQITRNEGINAFADGVIYMFHFQMNVVPCRMFLSNQRRW